MKYLIFWVKIKYQNGEISLLITMPTTTITFAARLGQVEKIEEVAAMIHASKSAAIRSLIEAGYEHMQER